MSTELGKAYVQIVPSAQGIKGSISNIMDGETESAGKTSGTNFVGALKKVIVAAGIGKVVKEALSAGADIQQSLGGIETLYKGSAEKMKQYANQAFETTGMSANSYMETVTSFSAGLISSMGGDTEAAAEVANRAMIDMSDNANKMGTDMSAIETAYQGFAKQNYTMLDNLKLGYGGTKTEMERLLADATELSGVEYNIDNLADVYNAIGVIQDELGITGTTALEASETFTGSFAAMKAAAENVLAGLTTGYNLGPSLQSLAQTVATFLFDNLIPMVVNFATALPGALVTFFTTAVPLFLQKGAELITNLIQGIQNNLPLVIEKMKEMGINMITTISENVPILLQKGKDLITNLNNGANTIIPQVIAKVKELGTQIIAKITENLPTMLQKGKELLIKLADGLIDRIPVAISNIANLMKNLLQLLIDNLPNFLSKGAELIAKLTAGFAQAFPGIMSKIGEIMRSIITSIAKEAPTFLAKGLELLLKMAIGIAKALPDILRAVVNILTGIIKGIVGYGSQMIGAGYDLLLGMATGISNAVSSVVGRAVEAAEKVVSSVKSFFGIRSPSRVFMEIGAYLDEGLAKGINDNLRPVEKAMSEMEAAASGSFENDVAFRAHGNLMQSQLNQANLQDSDSKMDALIGLVGKLVDKKQDLYLDKDTLVGGVLDDVDKLLEEKRSQTDFAVGGAY